VKSPTTCSNRRSRNEVPVKKRRHPGSGSRWVSASKLAQMGKCERLVAFEHLYGCRRSLRQERDRRRGLVEQEQFYRQGLAATSAHCVRGVPCFAATCLFGKFWLMRMLIRWSAFQRLIHLVVATLARSVQRWTGSHRGDK